MPLPLYKIICSPLRGIRQKQSLIILNLAHDLNIVLAHSTHVLRLSNFRHCCYGISKRLVRSDALSDIYGAVRQRPQRAIPSIFIFRQSVERCMPSSAAAIERLPR